MLGGVVVLQLQRKAVGKTTCFGHLVGGKQAARHRNLKILARLAWRVGGKRQFHLRLMRKRAGGAGQDLFKMFKRGFVRHQSGNLLHTAAISSFVGLTGARSVKTCACLVTTRSPVVRAPFTTAAKSLHTARLRR